MTTSERLEIERIIDKDGVSCVPIYVVLEGYDYEGQNTVFASVDERVANNVAENHKDGDSLHIEKWVDGICVQNTRIRGRLR